MTSHVLCIHFARLSIIDNMRLGIVICLDQEALTAATRARCHVTIISVLALAYAL